MSAASARAGRQSTSWCCTHLAVLRRSNLQVAERAGAPLRLLERHSVAFTVEDAGASPSPPLFFARSGATHPAQFGAGLLGPRHQPSVLFEQHSASAQVARQSKKYVCMYVCVYIYIHICVCVYIYIYIYIFIITPAKTHIFSISCTSSNADD